MKIVKYLLMLSIAFLSACAVMGDRTVNVTEAQIQEKLNERLAIPISLMKIFDVNLSNALVNFDQETGRLHTTMDTGLSSKLFNESLAGKVSISGKLRFDPETQSVMLDAPTIEQLDFPGLDAKYVELFSAFTKTMGKEMMHGLTLYKVKPEELTYAGTTYQPKTMQVTNQGLQITLSPQ